MSQGSIGYSILSNNINIGGSQTSAFGDIVSVEPTPVVQHDFIYGLNTQTTVTTVANSATADTSNGRLRLQSGTNSAGSAIFRSSRPARYRPGEGMLARFTPLFDATPRANNTQIWGVGSSSDGYFVGYNGTSLGLMHRNASVDTWIPQSTWNGDKLDGTGGSGITWRTDYGTPWMIIYPYLGYGNITWYMQNPTTSQWILVHTLRYANSSTATQLSNPSLYFYGQVLNSGNTNNVTMYCGSAAIFITGQRRYVSNPNWAMANNKTGITTETNVLTLKNATTYNGVTNRGVLFLDRLTISAQSTGTNIAIFRLKINSTLGGAPSYTTVNGTSADQGVTITAGNSITSYDTAGTTVTGGTMTGAFTVGCTGAGMVIDLSGLELFLAPGETLTISAFATASATVSAGITWTEDI